MSDKPILFSTPMIQALLDGRKTQTRRVIKPQPMVEVDGGLIVNSEGHVWQGYGAEPLACPYGGQGDYLWVRENWRPEQDKTGCACINYQADDFWQPIENTQQASERWIMLRRPHEQYPEMKPAVWRPSIHMPRWCSRLTLKITSVRVERVQDISEADALKDGGWEYKSCPVHKNPQLSFYDLWDSINAARGYGWDKNPWVWIITFEVFKINIDSLGPTIF